MTQTANLDLLCINTIRTLAMDAVQKAGSGHPGLPMGAAPMAYVLWTRFLRHNPANPDWPDRDRFILSAGHGSMLLYSLLHLTGYDLSLEELKNFRQWGSKTPGHPESFATTGVETTTGPLGQGFGNGVGLAIAERYLAARFNRPGHEIVNHFTYALCSDGDLMEGVSHEAASLAGHLKLGKLIYLYDDNRISIEGSTDLAFSEDRMKRFEAYGWHVQRVDDGNDIEGIDAAIRAAQKDERPSLIAVRTMIGFGSPGKQGTASAHGEPLGTDEIRLTKERLGWPLDPPFFIPDQALEHFRQALTRGKRQENEWKASFEAYAQAFPELAPEWRNWMHNELPQGWADELPLFSTDAKGMATRKASGQVLNALAPKLGNLIGGSADLAPSTKTHLEDQGDFQSGQYEGRNFHFGVREHGMGTVTNGMSLHGGVIAYGATFLIFSDYMRPPIRLAALMGLKVITVFTHDSIGLGEDGPTHQPVEQLAALRAIPGLTLIRPCDANETAEAWRVALEQDKGPVAICLTRQNVPTLDREEVASARGLSRGAYILKDFDVRQEPDVILMSSGSEIHIALEAARELELFDISVRVVSMPSWELFEKQEQDYQDLVFPPGVQARVAIEAGISQGWHRYLGLGGRFVGMSSFGASAPYQTLYDKFGLTAGQVKQEALNVLGKS
ncbi:MAG: transketolase [Desulfovermiculus sp.]|nr:transketolase [Desulfovermiculus sp.]